MAKIGQIRGALLEELLLYLLRASGYITVEKIQPDDETLRDGGAGLELLGRGGVHQIDAIADFVISPPFSNPQRLLIEAKCLDNNVGIGIVRNAVGVLKDVEEYWVSRNGIPAKERYHYQYALFSATEYSEPAQKYAYAHDIYLIPLEESTFMQPVVKKVKNIRKETFDADSDNISINLKDLRRAFRGVLRNNDEVFNNHPNIFERENLRGRLLEMRESSRRVEYALVGMISKRFPIFLVPSHQTSIRSLISDSPHSSRIFLSPEGESCRIESVSGNTPFFEFSFDLPRKLFDLYKEQGVLSPSRAVEMKGTYMQVIEAIFLENDIPHLIRFQTDRDWLRSLQPTRAETTTQE